MNFNKKKYVKMFKRSTKLIKINHKILSQKKQNNKIFPINKFIKIKII